MRRLILTACLLTAGIASAADLSLSWTPPTENEDGTPLTDLDGYNVYCGNTAGGPYDVVIDDVTDSGANTHVIDPIAEGDWFCVVTAYDTSANESVFSNAANVTISIPPAPPTGLVVDNLTAYTLLKQPDRFVLLPVGTVPVGTSCDTSQSVNGHYVVPNDAVTFTGTVQPIVVVAKCS